MGPALDAIARAVESAANSGDDRAVRDALRAVTPDQVTEVMAGGQVPRDSNAADSGRLVAVGLGIVAGVGTGVLCRDPDEALDLVEAGQAVVLLRSETRPADEPVMHLCEAVVTERGGTTSHAAVIARGLGIVAVCGAGPIDIDDGTFVSVDGTTGEIRAVDPDPAALRRAGGRLVDMPEPLQLLLRWADGVVDGRTTVLANVDSAAAAQRAQRLGAAGVGLCRTEHLFVGDASGAVASLLAGLDERFSAELLEDVVEHQRAALSEILVHFDALPVAVRLLDAPTHEFSDRVEHEPLLGLRGARLGLLHPELVEAQTAAIAGSVADLMIAGGDPQVSIVVPMVSLPEELAAVAGIVNRVSARTLADRGVEATLPIGVMIETPRAALCADRLAPLVSGFSFGTNDLTQLVYGWSRDDLAVPLTAYREAGMIDANPFETLDTTAVVRLMEIAAEAGWAAHPGLQVGMCGEHGGDAASVAAAVRLGLQSVSCPADRVPAARLAVAQAWLDRSEGPR